MSKEKALKYISDCTMIIPEMESEKEGKFEVITVVDAKEALKIDSKNVEMHVYEVGYWSHEESPRYLLYSDKKFTKKQFDDLVSDCFKVAYQNKNNDSNHVNVEELLSEAVEILKGFGFKEYETTASFIPFGWACVKNNEDWKEGEDSELKLIRDKINYS
jgi:hypothetical protein